MSYFKRILCTVLSLTLLLPFSACGRSEYTANTAYEPNSLSNPEKRVREKPDGDIFLSTEGNDLNSGSSTAPVASVSKAVELAKALNKTQKVIYISAGEYDVSAIELTAEDNDITFFGDGDVIFNGGITLSASDFTEYKDNILVLDLQRYGVTAERIGDIHAFGQYNTAEKYGESGSLYCELFCGDKRMTLARYPNEGETLKTGEVIDNGDSSETYPKSGTVKNPEWKDLVSPKGGTFSIDNALAERIKSWKNSPDKWMFGYFYWDWADMATPLLSSDSSSVTTKYASVYGFKKDAPYYFFNIFEELDQENEWYIDKENLKLYFIPPTDFEDKTISLSLETDNLFTINNAENICFDGITFTSTRSSAVKGNGNNITVKNSTIKNVGENGVELCGSNINIENNTITATGKSGIILDGGDRQTLTSSGNRAVNNLIYDWSQIYKTYQPAVNLKGVGAVCSHNEIYDSPHEAIAYTGNNHIIEYNIIHDVVKNSSDAGAIYAGRSWSYYGNKVRYNCIYNVGTGSFTPSAIYFDDALSGQEAYGNLLINIAGCGILAGGGRDLNIENNIIINTKTPIHYDDRAIAGIEDKGWFTHANTPGEGLWATLNEVDIQSDIWKSSFPTLSTVSNDFNDTDNPSFAANPTGSSVENNIIVNSKKNIGDIDKKVYKYSYVKNNSLYSFDDSPVSLDGSYSLTECPDGFNALPLEKIGREYTVEG